MKSKDVWTSTERIDCIIKLRGDAYQPQPFLFRIGGARSSSAQSPSDRGSFGLTSMSSRRGCTLRRFNAQSARPNQIRGLRPRGPLAFARGAPTPRSAPAGAPVARLARYAARANEYKILVSGRITGQTEGLVLCKS